jgi:hypothetical protein
VVTLVLVPSQIRGAEPLTEREHRELQQTMVKVDKALGSLESYLSTPSVSVHKTDQVRLRMHCVGFLPSSPLPVWRET